MGRVASPSAACDVVPTTQILRLTRCGVDPTAFAKRPAESVVTLFAADPKRIRLRDGHDEALARPALHR